ncbi:MAG: hypothetical protein EAZ07_05480 [Cytophagales bacterium]|nr:MAG: hypothetical protein EAZ07_05480 [Cytophagales bacterium]
MNNLKQPQKNSSTNTEISEPQKNDSFTLENLEKLWQNHLKQCKEKGLLNHCLILDRPITLENEIIHLKLDNVIQEDQLNEFKLELLEYLRTNLKNNMVNIKVSIKKEEEIKKIYTSREKYIYLNEKFPQLDQLRTRLGLDLYD